MRLLAGPSATRFASRDRNVGEHEVVVGALPSSGFRRVLNPPSQRVSYNQRGGLSEALGWLASAGVPMWRAMTALMTGGMLLILARRLPKMLLHTRIRRHLELVHALREHAVDARSLAAMPELSAHPDRQRALKQIQAKVLAQLTRGRALVDNLLLELHGDRPAALMRSGTALAALAACEMRSREAVADEKARLTHLPGMAALSLPAGRDVQARSEQQALKELGEGAGSGAVVSPCRLRQLTLAVGMLRKLEVDLDFQAELLSCQLKMEASTDYSRDNFAYGSTPLSSWLELFACEPVQAVIQARPAAELRYVVLGSSTGWLCFYGACVYGFRTRGIELLPNLVAAAKRTAREAAIFGVHFECDDMLRSDLRGSHLIILASQCWDAPLLAAVRVKLLDELPTGALVLDYTPLLGEPPETSRDERMPMPAKSEGRSLQLACTVSAPVSWDGTHKFWVWRVC